MKFRFFPYYLNTRRLTDLAGVPLPKATQNSLNDNSGERRGGMEEARLVAKGLLHSGTIPNLTTVIAEREVTDERVLAFLWGVFTFRDVSKALSLEKAGKRVKNATFSGTIPLGECEYTLSGEMSNEHYYSTSSISVLTGKRRMLILGHFGFNDDLTVDVSPYIIGEMAGDDIFATSLSHSVRTYPTSIDQFSKINDVARPTPAEIKKMLDIPEEFVKSAFAEIIGEPYVPKDWGGEKSDLQTTRLTIDGKPTPAAFIFKGPSVSGELHPANMGKRGDQLPRAFDEPVELIVIQHCNKIANTVVRIAESLAYDARNPRRYCTLDGADTAHILKAYGYLNTAISSL